MVCRREYDTASFHGHPTSFNYRKDQNHDQVGTNGRRYIPSEISKELSMINNSDLARLYTRSKLSRCDRLRSLPSVSSVILMRHPAEGEPKGQHKR